MSIENSRRRIAPHPKTAAQLGDRRMACVELGGGLSDRGGPAVSAPGRCVLPDLIGRGDSDQLANPGRAIGAGAAGLARG